MKQILLASLLYTSSYSNKQCEQAIIDATIIGMKFAETNIGYKKTIVADKKVKKLCNYIKNKG